MRRIQRLRAVSNTRRRSPETKIDLRERERKQLSASREERNAAQRNCATSPLFLSFFCYFLFFAFWFPLFVFGQTFFFFTFTFTVLQNNFFLLKDPIDGAT